MGEGRDRERQGAGPGPKAQPAAPGVPPGQNLRQLAGWRPVVAVTLGATVSGALLSTAFPPLEWDWAAWIALIPVLLAPVPTTPWRRAAAGALLGLVHCISNLFWLNEIGFCAGVLLGVYCALFPLLWYLGTAALSSALADPEPRPGRRLCCVRLGWPQAALIVGSGVLWVGLEWLRSWLFTGFPWNELGVSQWQRPLLLSLTCFTGIAGVSLLVAAGNLALSQIAAAWWDGIRRGASRRQGRAPTATLATVAALAAMTALQAPPVPPTDAVLRVLAVQGNIPQCRFWTEAQFNEALAVYSDLTVTTAHAGRADLVVWPESAVPAPLGYAPFKARLEAILPEVRTPLLIGALDSRPLPGARWTGSDWEPPLQDFNSAILLAPDGQVMETYDKVHRVPFGEYVPFGRYLPWLVDWIGMGRDLVPGSEFTVFRLGKGAVAGANICFEDAFPEISREFVRRGANLLVTLTNDAWYAESSGSRQHLLHAVFRAAENRRPLFRSGNNSDTCLITANGTVTGLLYDPATGHRFFRGARFYEIPISYAPPLTLYARWGDWLSRTCAAGAALLCLILAARAVRGCARRRRAVETRSVA